MALISILLGILLDRYWPQVQQWRQYDWYFRLNDWLLEKSSGHLHNPTIKFLALLSTPVIVIALLQYASSDWLILLSLLFSIVVFIYCLDSLAIEQHLDELITALNNNESPDALVESITNESVSDSNLVDAVLKSTLSSIIERLFGVIFWFAILGPVGAVIYRFSQLLHEKFEHDAVLSKITERMMELLNWLPSRFLCLSFAITGHFEGAMAAYNENKETDRNQQFLLIDICHGALEGNDTEEKAAYLVAFRGLILRSLIVWLSAIALLTLLGWN